MPKSNLTPCPEPSSSVGSSGSLRRSRVVLLRAAAAVALLATVISTGAGTATASVVGPDVSSYNHGNGAHVNWKAVRSVGRASFAFIKATEGGDYRNPNFSSDYASAQAEGLIRGAYHYAHPGGGSNRDISTKATAEAAKFGEAIGPLAGPGNLAPVLDLEDAGHLNPSQLSLWVHSWLNRMMTLTGRTPIIYTGVSFWRDSMGNSQGFGAYPLWLASYGVARPPVVGGWKSYTFWQYTSSGQMAGVGTTDLSVFNGSFAQLNAMTATNAATRAAAADAAARSAQMAAAAAAAERSRAAAAAASATAALTLRFTTRAEQPPSDASGRDAGSSRSGLRSWLGVFGLDGSRSFSGD